MHERSKNLNMHVDDVLEHLSSMIEGIEIFPSLRAKNRKEGKERRIRWFWLVREDLSSVISMWFRLLWTIGSSSCLIAPPIIPLPKLDS